MDSFQPAAPSLHVSVDSYYLLSTSHRCNNRPLLIALPSHSYSTLPLSHLAIVTSIFQQVAPLHYLTYRLEHKSID